MAKSRVRESAREIAEEIERAIREQAQATLEDAVDARAEEMKNFAVSISPEDTGQYKDSFEINKVERPDGLPGRSLSNSDPIAGLLEYGSVHNEEFAVLGRTAQQFGGSVDH